MRNQKILKSVLLLRKAGNRHSTKEEQIAEVNQWFEKGYMTDDGLQEWIDGLKEDLTKTPEQIRAESEQFLETLLESEAEYDIDREDREYIPSCTAGDYGPSHPWDAPGMTIHDFI